MKPGKYGDAIPEPGDVVYRRGSPQSLGVVTALRVDESGHRYYSDDEVITKANAKQMLADGKVWRGQCQVQVTWMNPNTGNRSRITNRNGPTDWINADTLGGPIDELIATTQRKLDTHSANRLKALAWAKDQGIL